MTYYLWLSQFIQLIKYFSNIQTQYNQDQYYKGCNKIMIYIVDLVALVLVAYSLIKIIRRKICKPNYQGKTVWITGASSGIGEYLAYQFSRLGASLILSARNQKQLQRVRQACTNKNKVTIVKLDMTNYQDIRKTTNKIIEDLQAKNMKLDVVVENAGVSMRAQFKEYDFQNHLSMFQVNVNGPTLHIQCVLNHMIKNKSGQIVGITSVQGKLAPPFRTSYSGSKHAMVGILDSMRSEFYKYGISVTNIMPGYVNTNLSKNAFAAKAGEKFGHDETQGRKGLNPEEFCRSAVKAIYMKQNQAQISNQFDVPIGFILRNLCPDLVFFGLKMKAKQKKNKNL